MEKGLISALLSFIEEEKIRVRLQKKSDSEFWLESPGKSMVAKFIVDGEAREVLYDVFSTEYHVHLKEETLRDVEKIDFVAEEHRRWELARAAENVWLILDRIALWARDNGYKIKECELI